MHETRAVPVDFGNADECGAVRLHTPGTIAFFQAQGIEPHEGLVLRITDGELTAEGRCTWRDPFCVLIIERWFD